MKCVVFRVAILLFLNHAIGHSQNTHYPVKLLSVQDGLPNSTVNGIAQDQTGFIWIATEDGLARYDGRAFKVFRHETGTAGSSSDNNITSLKPAHNGAFLLGTANGNFKIFDPATERFTMLFSAAFLAKNNASFDACQLTGDGKGVWGIISNDRLIYYDLQRKKFTFWDEFTLTGERQTIRDVLCASTGLVYVRFKNGLVELDPKRRYHLRVIPFPQEIWHNPEEMPVGTGTYLFERPNGDLVTAGKDRLILFHPDHPEKFREVPVPEPAKPLRYSTLSMLRDGSVFLGSGSNLYRLTPDNQLTLTWQQNAKLTSLDYVRAFLIDHSGVLWLSSNAGNVTRLDLNALPFKACPYRKGYTEDLLEIELGAPLPDWDHPERYPGWVRFNGLPNSGSSWFIDFFALYHYDARQHRFYKKLRYADLGYESYISLKPSADGQLWVYANRQGLISTDTTARTFRRYPDSTVPRKFKNANAGFDAFDIQPQNEWVWIASAYGFGLYQYDLRKQKFIRQLRHAPSDTTSLSTNSLNCLTLDPNDPRMLWVGTQGGGLCRLDTRTMRCQRVGAKEGLPDNTINGILTDRKGFLWVSTNQGLTRLDPRSLRMRHFTVADGLQDAEFVRNQAARLPDGRLVFGGKTGMTVFDPLAIDDDTFQPPVALTFLKINNLLVEVGKPDSPLAQSLNATNQLTLAHTQNFLTFEFAGLQYNKPEKLNYRYQLVGVDKDWVYAGTQNSANYTQLAPGDYVFMVNATNADGQWSNQTRKLAVTITPPFWKTWWAYGFYALLAGGSGFVFFQFRNKRNREQQEMELKRREAEQLKTVDEMKTRFFSNVTHEFRTPLSLILSPTEQMLQVEALPQEIRHGLTSVHRNAGQLLRLVNQLLDLSKLEAYTMQVALSRGNPEQVIREIVESFRPAADGKGILLEYSGEEIARDFLFDADKWEKIVFNLLSNALKFTPVGTIRVELRVRDERMLQLRISDTGIGIPAEKLPHIFDRFYQVDDSRTRMYEGTGIGLALVKELIDLLKGSITVQSTPGQGTTFEVQLPIAPAEGYEAQTLWKISPAEAVWQPSNDTSPEISDANELTGPLLLVVEDNAELLDFIARSLAPGYRVLTARNGKQGLAVAQEEIPDLVISDVMMPEMDGYSLCQHIKKNPQTDHIAVLLLTARSSHESRIDGLSSGADDYLTKPFHLDELLLRVRNLLDHQQKLREFYRQQLSSPENVVQTQAIENAFLQKTRQAIENHLAEEAFSIEDLSREVAMSRTQMHRKLKALTGLSASLFMRQIRLQHAVELLCSTDLSISEIAYKTGFNSLTYFTRCFAEQFGRTPSEFRKTHPKAQTKQS